MNNNKMMQVILNAADDALLDLYSIKVNRLHVVIDIWNNNPVTPMTVSKTVEFKYEVSESEFYGLVRSMFEEFATVN